MFTSTNLTALLHESWRQYQLKLFYGMRITHQSRHGQSWGYGTCPIPAPSSPALHPQSEGEIRSVAVFLRKRRKLNDDDLDYVFDGVEVFSVSSE